MAGDQQRIGSWSARQLAPDTKLTSVPDELADRMPDVMVGGPSSPPESSPKRRSERGMAFSMGLLVGLIPLLLVAAGLVGYLLAADSDDDAGQTTSAEGTAPSTVPAAPSSSTVPAAPSESGSATPAIDPTTLLPPRAEVRDGTLYLEGAMPPEVVAGYVDEFTKLATALGYDLADETTIVDGALVPAEIPTRFADAVFFETSSDVLDPQFLPILDSIAAYMLEGSADLTIVSHTDASGSEATNLHLAHHRGGEVYDYLVATGIDPLRMSVDARGEADASGEGGAQAMAERRVEFLFKVEP